MFVILLLVVPVYAAPGQAQPDVPTEYRQYFAKYEDNRSLMERVLNLGGLSGQDVGRSFALIAGVSNYPNMSSLDQQLKPAEEDLRKLEEYLKQYEFFDEIVVLKNEAVTTENFEYFLQSYFPGRLKKFPQSRFLFAYSGHGMTEGARGYVLKNTARHLSDKANSINLSLLRVLLGEVIMSGHHVLALINSCYSGAFTGRVSFGQTNYQQTNFIPKYKGAHAITAGGSSERTIADSRVGPGSIFFEKVFAGLDGRADLFTDGLVTSHELAAFLRNEVQIYSAYSGMEHHPQFGDLSMHSSKGEFFFLNRERQVEEGIVPPWNPDNVTVFGGETAKILEQAKQDYRSGNLSSAVSGFRRAAQQDNAEAMAYLGYIYEQGFGVPVNYGESFYWTQKAAEAGNFWGMGGLGVMYRDGTGVEQDYMSALNWFRKGAEAGNARAMTNLGAMYDSGKGVTQNSSEAVRWYRQGAEAGDALAMAYLGVMYLNGTGVSQNYATAIEWYRKAIQAGDATARGYLGYMYENGYGVVANDVEAVRLYQQGAEAGDDYSMGRLGRMYEYGYGVSENLAEAVRWYRKAAGEGNEWARNRLTDLGESY